MRISLSCLLLAGAIAMVSVPPGRAEDVPYMTLAGELAGAVESPRVVLEACVARKAGRRGDYQAAYEAWRARHATLLTQVDAQLARADARLRRDNPAAGASSVADAMTRILQRRYESLDAAALRQLCSRYPEMLRAKDAEMTDAVPRLLQRVADAERAAAAKQPG
ncbi:MAG: hypothetical protein MUF07_10770 [Steroidobacteraceae bacterium]|jgi:hypothetical protein|nr:hypothetical protein [Steroidobacteraceae bacterium]